MNKDIEYIINIIDKEIDNIGINNTDLTRGKAKVRISKLLLRVINKYNGGINNE